MTVEVGQTELLAMCGNGGRIYHAALPSGELNGVMSVFEQTVVDGWAVVVIETPGHVAVCHVRPGEEGNTYHWLA